MKLNRTQRYAISRLIQAADPSCRCVARPKARVQHWEVLFESRRLRVMYNSRMKHVRSEAIDITPAAEFATAS